MRSFSELIERIRYNPLPRLFINALKRIGIVALPYYVFRHDLVSLQCPELDRAGTRLVELQEADMAGIAALPLLRARVARRTGQLLLDVHRACEGQR